MASTTTSAGGNVSATITNNASSVSRSGNTVSASVTATWKQTSSWTSNSVKCWIPSGGTAYTLFNSNSGASHTNSSTTYSKTASCSWTVGASDTSLTYAVGFGWNAWSPSQKTTLNNTISFAANTASFNLNVLDPDGSEPYTTGAAGSVEQSINSGSYSRVYNESASSYNVGTTFAYRNFTPGTGRKLSSVSGISPSNTTGPWSATLSSSGLTVAFKTAWKTYTVSYDANGGSSTPSSVTVTHGNSTNLASAISRNNGTSTANETITISYNANNGSSTPSNSTGTAVNTTTTTYTFNKWALGSTSGTQYAAGASYSPTADSKFYATWSSSSTTARTTNPSITLASSISRSNSTVSSYTVSYNANGGSSTPSTQTATKTRAYTFNKWNTNSSGTGTDYSASTAYTFSSNTTLYAKWNSSDSGGSVNLASAISRNNSAVAGYSVSYNANGGSGAPSSETSGNRTVTYTFNKWAAGSTTGTQYSAGASYTPSADTTMYALWNSSTSANSSWTCSSVVPTRTGYTFLGWSTDQNATTAEYTSGTTHTITSAKTLYAVWQINNYYLDLNGYCDGVNQSNIADFGKCDVYINGELKATQVTDYYKAWPYGSTYEFKNITPDWGVKYNGVYMGSISGTIGAANVSTRLSFTRLPVTVNANVNNAWETGIVWINVNGTWEKARALHIRHEDEWERLEKIDFTL